MNLYEKTVLTIIVVTIYSISTSLSRYLLEKSLKTDGDFVNNLKITPKRKTFLKSILVIMFAVIAIICLEITSKSNEHWLYILVVNSVTIGILGLIIGVFCEIDIEYVEKNLKSYYTKKKAEGGSVSAFVKTVIMLFMCLWLFILFLIPLMIWLIRNL